MAHEDGVAAHSVTRTDYSTARAAAPNTAETARSQPTVTDLVARREALGLSQTVVAARMGTSQSAVARLERGDADLRVSTLERYAAALEVDLGYTAEPRA